MADTNEEVPFSSHLNELRRRLVWSLIGVFVAFAVAFGFFADDIVRYVKDIAVIQHDPGDETYLNFDAAVDMPYRAVGSTWTHKVIATNPQTDEQTVTFETSKVLETTSKKSRVSLTTVDQDHKQINATEYTYTFGEQDLGEDAADDEKQPKLTTVDVPGGEFECFYRVIKDDADAHRIWLANQGGVVVREVDETGAMRREALLTDHQIESFQEEIEFTVIASLETFSTTMRVSLYAALVFAYPWVMLQIYLFVAPGLYRHERNFFRFAIPSIFVLFAAGAAFGRYLLLPISIPFLLGFNVQEFGVETNYSLAQFLALVFAMTFGLGFVFQIPLLVAPVIRFGLLSPEFFKSKRRYTVLIAVVIGAIVSPSGSPIDMLLAGAPVFFLVEAGVWIGRIWKRAVLRRAEKLAVAAAKRGEKVDPEALAGGLAVDLEQRLKDFSTGGARKIARELISGFRDSGKDIESIFDDDYADDEKPPTEVKLKRRERKKDKPEVAEPANDLKPDQMHDVKFVTDEVVGASEPAAEDQGDWPDRPWDNSVDEDVARYIEDRISQRLEQFIEREVRPWMARVEHELRELKDDDES